MTENNIVTLYDEVRLMQELGEETVSLIHSTTLIDAIKLLVNAHDIINLNLLIQEKYREYKNLPPWDLHSLNDLSRIKREIYVYHRKDFNPSKLVDKYTGKMGKFFRVVQFNRERDLGFS